MLLHLARISVVTIALALVVGAGYLLSRPSTPTVIAVVVPNSPVVAAAPAAAAQPVVQHVHHASVWHPYWYGYVYAHPYHGCGGRVCWH